MVAVSQAPAVSEAPAAVAPPVGGATVAVLPSAVQDLARFFLSLLGSSSLGAVGGVVGVAAPASGVGAQLCPSTLGGRAVASCAATAMPAGAVNSPAASAAVPSSSGRQQRQEVSRSSRRRRRSSSDVTGRTKKKRTRDHSLSPGRSSCRQEKSCRSSDSSEDDRAAASPISGRAPGGTPGDSRPTPAGDRSPRPGPSGWRPRLSAGAEWYRSGFGGCLSTAPSGETDDDRSNTLDALDIDRDDSFRSVLALIRNFHNMEKPAGVPLARCKASLASIYGLMSETSPAFHLPTSPLMWSLLDNTNLALSKFLEDQTVHDFLPVPSRRHRRYYRTSSSSFPGPYSVSPVPSPVFWTVDCSPGLHQGLRSCVSVGTLPRDQTSPLSGRLVDSCLFGAGSQAGRPVAPLALSHPRDCDKREEVRSYALADCEVSRHDHRYQGQQGFSVSGASREISDGWGELLYPGRSPGSALAGDPRSPGFARAAGPSRSPSDALLAVASEDALVPRVRPSLSSGAFAAGSETGPVLVNGEGSFVDGGSIRDTCYGSSPVFRRVLFGVGHSPP